MRSLKRIFTGGNESRRANANPDAGSKSRFSPGLCNELIALHDKHPDKLFSEKHRFGLKQFGTLIALDWILEHKPARALEMGAGNNLLFDQLIGEICDYWMIDDAGFYEPKQFAASATKRQNTTFVSGLVGQKLEGAPAGHFDLIFSVSVLEHVPPADIQSVSDHMYELLAPNGRIVHSLDLPLKYASRRASRWFSALKSSGFDIPDPTSFDEAGEAPGGSIIMEPMHIVHEFYGKTAKGDARVQAEWHNTTYIIDAGKKQSG